jgi:hypothetical protein
VKTHIESAAIEGYRSFLEARDGQPDLDRNLLPVREDFYREIERAAVRSRRAFPRHTFLRGVSGDVDAVRQDRRLLWLVATAKANQAERFGVELGRLYGLGPSEDGDPERTHVVLQEGYHTRTLADVVAMFGLRIPQQPPRRSARWLIHAMVFNPLPERFVLPLVGMSEMMGCALFRLLRDEGVELFADEPEVAARIRLLFDEILADEISHVGLVEARLGRWGRGVMRGLYARLAHPAMRRMGPEVVALFGPDRLRAAVHAPFDQGALASQFPKTAYTF